MEHFGKLMKQNEFTVIIVLGKKKSKTMPHPPSRGHSSHWQKFILLALVERVLLQSVYVEDAKKMKETLDSVSAQLQVVYQQKLRLQKNLKEKVEAEEQLQNGMEQFKHNGVQCALLRCEEETCRSEEYSRKSASHELESVKQQLKELQKDFEALENTKNNLTSQLNFQKAECQEKLNNLTESQLPAMTHQRQLTKEQRNACFNFRLLWQLMLLALPMNSDIFVIDNAASVCDKQFSAVITFGTL
ncbi:hypothetical protein T03_2135 [Trichinella britovi]|uniref:Uncharacterized protein n=1 Tax=Trichinella britovi TaxID=45882 RepID=A0A0V1D9V5_TRIBR|nr:hypothetical protein T03_2135 [Trichinella britovi]